MSAKSKDQRDATEQFSAKTNAANHKISFNDRKGIE